MSRHEQLVYQEIEPCPYLPEKEACMPLRWQMRPPVPEAFDQSLSEGDRRVGRMLYRTACPSCKACQAIRVPVKDFKLSRSLRKTLKKGSDITVELGPAIFTEERLTMYNRHKTERGLSTSDKLMTQKSYENWFIYSCADTREFRYYLGDSLIGISVVDFGKNDISSVYFFFDPDYSHYSLGTFSAVTEMLWMKARGMRYYYLGLYVAECAHLNYKARYHPHQRLIDGSWCDFSDRKAQ